MGLRKDLVFTDSGIYTVLMIPVQEWKRSKYYFFFKLPYIILLLTIGLCMAIVMDFFVGMSIIGD